MQEREQYVAKSNTVLLLYNSFPSNRSGVRAIPAAGQTPTISSKIPDHRNAEENSQFLPVGGQNHRRTADFHLKQQGKGNRRDCGHFELTACLLEILLEIWLPPTTRKTKNAESACLSTLFEVEKDADFDTNAPPFSVRGCKMAYLTITQIFNDCTQ